MSKIDEQFVQDLVPRTQGITLSSESVRRSAGSLGAVMRTLDRLASGSLFDTEPAQFDRELARQAGSGRRD